LLTLVYWPFHHWLVLKTTLWRLVTHFSATIACSFYLGKDKLTFSCSGSLFTWLFKFLFWFLINFEASNLWLLKMLFALVIILGTDCFPNIAMWWDLLRVIHILIDWHSQGKCKQEAAQICCLEFCILLLINGIGCTLGVFFDGIRILRWWLVY
jgi:hypothetical protein